MNVLAIDTALAAASACVLRPGQKEPIAGETLLMERGHAEALLPLIDRVMARVDGGFASIARVVVTTGPGSFTGIRIGIAAARAIGLACNAPVVGVSVLAGLAASVSVAQGSVVAAIDARHGQVFFQGFDGQRTARVAPRIAPLREAVRAVSEGPLHVIGSGARLFVAEAKVLGVRAFVAGTPPAPEIAFVARLGAGLDPAEAPARPLYLKVPDAAPQTGGRIARA